MSNESAASRDTPDDRCNSADVPAPDPAMNDVSSYTVEVRSSSGSAFLSDDAIQETRSCGE